MSAAHAFAVDGAIGDERMERATRWRHVPLGEPGDVGPTPLAGGPGTPAGRRPRAVKKVMFLARGGRTGQARAAVDRVVAHGGHRTIRRTVGRPDWTARPAAVEVVVHEDQGMPAPCLIGWRESDMEVGPAEGP